MKIFQFILLAVIFTLTSIHHLASNFWNDEIYSLVNFILVPVKTTVLDYHVPNNHVLFSLFSKAIFNTLGIADYSFLIDHPFIARLPLLAIPSLLCILLWKVSSHFFSSFFWRYMVLLLFYSNVVFGNFYFQYRGYGLSALWLTWLFYLSLRSISSGKLSVLRSLGLVTGSFAVFYTIPSNLYMVVAIGLIPSVFYLLREKSIRTYLTSLEFKIGISLLLGLGFGLLAYSPVFTDVFANEYVTNGKPFAFTNFERIFNALFRLSSFHVIPFGFGVYYIVKAIIRKELNTNASYWYPALICLLPCVFSFIHGDVPPYRVYSVLLPFFIILLTFSIKKLLALIPAKMNFNVQLVLPLYILLHFVVVEAMVYTKLENDNLNGKRSQDLTYQYYNYHFRTNDLLLFVKQNHDLKVYAEKDWDGLGTILNSVPTRLETASLSAVTDDTFLFVSNETTLPKTPGYRSELLTSETNYFKVFKIRRSK